MPVSYNRMKFLLECLNDLDEQFKQHGGPGLFIFRGKPAKILHNMKIKFGINKVCYEQDCEPIWHKRDLEIVSMCQKLNIQTVEKVSHTLWDPMDIIRVNGGFAPLTYEMMLHNIDVVGLPLRPANDDVDLSKIEFGRIPESLGVELGLIKGVKKREFSFKIKKRRFQMCFFAGPKTRIFLNLSSSI